MWYLGKRESVNAWKKADFDGFRDNNFGYENITALVDNMPLKHYTNDAS
jgi:hypothetical protein